MSDAIGKSQFVTSFTQANPDGFFARADVDAPTRDLLARAGVSQQDLYEIAGDDGVIRGEGELAALFGRLDAHDRDGSSRTFHDGTVRAAYLALLHDAGAAARPGARVGPEAASSRQPSAWASAHYRDVMGELKRRADGLAEPRPHDAAGTVLKVTSLTVDGIELAEMAGLELEAGLAGTVVLAGVGPILGIGTALYEIGEANEAADRANSERVQVASFAAGLAAGLDPARGSRVPADPGGRAAFLEGCALVARMTPTQRTNLEDVLVLARRHATTAAVDYDARTYKEAVMDVYEGTWDPARN